MSETCKHGITIAARCEDCDDAGWYRSRIDLLGRRVAELEAGRDLAHVLLRERGVADLDKITHLRASVAELEALFQSTHGVHWSWVAKEAEQRKRIAELEAALHEVAVFETESPTGSDDRDIEQMVEIAKEALEKRTLDSVSGVHVGLPLPFTAAGSFPEVEVARLDADGTAKPLTGPELAAKYGFRPHGLDPAHVHTPCAASVDDQERIRRMAYLLQRGADHLDKHMPDMAGGRAVLTSTMRDAAEDKWEEGEWEGELYRSVQRSNEATAVTPEKPKIGDIVTRVQGAETQAEVVQSDGDHRVIRWPSGSTDRVYWADLHVVIPAESRDHTTAPWPVCACGHHLGEHWAREPGACSEPGCGCKAFDLRPRGSRECANCGAKAEGHNGSPCGYGAGPQHDWLPEVEEAQRVPEVSDQLGVRALLAMVWTGQVPVDDRLWRAAVARKLERVDPGLADMCSDNPTPTADSECIWCCEDAPVALADRTLCHGCTLILQATRGPVDLTSKRADPYRSVLAEFVAHTKGTVLTAAGFRARDAAAVLLRDDNPIPAAPGAAEIKAVLWRSRDENCPNSPACGMADDPLPDDDWCAACRVVQDVEALLFSAVHRTDTAVPEEKKR